MIENEPNLIQRKEANPSYRINGDYAEKSFPGFIEFDIPFSKMITLNEFRAMDISEKIKALGNGVFLADRKEGEIIIRLYKLASFYVESFSDLSRNKTVHFIAFNSNDLLLPYIKR
jgi:hypothetical protein